MLMGTLQTAGPALMILFGGWLVVSGHASLGTVFVFATIPAAWLAGSVTSLAGMHVNITGSQALLGGCSHTWTGNPRSPTRRTPPNYPM
jgi:hypothetical protein